MPKPPASRRLCRSSSSSRSPSLTVLALIASLAAPACVSSSPPPLDFLCPSINIPVPTPTRTRRSISRLAKRSAVRNLPDKFELDDTGRWKRVDAYTLYGSTVCLSCDNPAPTLTSFDEDAASASPTSTYDIHDTLPPGWNSPDHSSPSRTSLILALSLVLALIICILIVGSLYWRRNQRRKRRQIDVENKLKSHRRSRPPSLDDDRISILEESRTKIKQKLWAKATARWKANVRYTARQRKGKRVVSTSTKSPSPRSSFDRTYSLETTPIQPPSPSLSRQRSLDPSSTNPHLESQEITEIETEPPNTPASRPPSPPAYHSRVAIPTVQISSCIDDHVKVYDFLNTPSSHSTLSHSSASDYGEASSDATFSARSIHSAHVATDDKAMLARLAYFASAPSADPNLPHVSAPMWQDERLEDFVEDTHSPAVLALPPSRHSSPSPSPTLFPPPPSSNKMATSIDDYTYAFGDISEPDSGPSAPPFEEPDRMHNFIPSAPPLSEAEHGYYSEYYASAPTQDRHVASESLRFPTEQYGGGIPPIHSNLLDSRTADSTTNPLVHGPISSDGTPPCYQP